MPNAIEKIKEATRGLLIDGQKIIFQSLESYKAKEQINIHEQYQNWYHNALKIVEAIAPDRAVEFKIYYTGAVNRKKIDVTTYGLRDFLLGNRSAMWSDNENFSAFFSCLQSQYLLFSTICKNIDSELSRIVANLRYDIAIDDIDASQTLLNAGHLRAAGALAGVVLESHLKAICLSKGILFAKKNVTISDCNDALKDKGIVDSIYWRHIQRLGDIRNLSVHKKDREPTKDEIQDLIVGVRKMMVEVV